MTHVTRGMRLYNGRQRGGKIYGKGKVTARTKHTVTEWCHMGTSTGSDGSNGGVSKLGRGAKKKDVSPGKGKRSASPLTVTDWLKH